MIRKKTTKVYVNNSINVETVNKILAKSPIISRYFAKKPYGVEIITSGKYLLKHPTAIQINNEIKCLLNCVKTRKEAQKIISDFVEEKKILASIQLLENICTIEKFNLYLSNVAEAVMSNVIEFALKKFSSSISNDWEFALMAIGSLGTQQFTTMSDIDIIPVFRVNKLSDKEDARKVFTSVMKEISAVLSPSIYRIDCKPSLSSSKTPLVYEYKEMKKFQNDRRMNWEMMNLSKARIITPSQKFGEDIKAEVRKLISVKRSVKTLLCMFETNASEIKSSYRDKSYSLDMKYSDGGILDIIIIIRYLVLKSSNPNLFVTNTVNVIKKLGYFEMLSRKDSAELGKAYKFLHRVSCFMKIAGISPSNATDEDLNRVAPEILENSKATAKNLRQKISASMAKSKAVKDKYFN